MTNKFEDIDNDMLSLFLEDMLPATKQMSITNSLKTYKDLWLLANMYNSCEVNRKRNEVNKWVTFHDDGY